MKDRNTHKINICICTCINRRGGKQLKDRGKGRARICTLCINIGEKGEAI